MKHLLKQFAQREAHPVIQFVKYGIGGAAATAVDVFVFYLLAWTLLPGLTEQDPLIQTIARFVPVEIEPISEAIRERNFYINSGIAFIFSNMTAYFINIYWVFEPGRHKRHVEIALFYVVSLVSIVIGILLGGAMIRFFGLSTTASYLGKMIAAVLINYVCRKYLVFKG